MYCGVKVAVVRRCVVLWKVVIFVVIVTCGVDARKVGLWVSCVMEKGVFGDSTMNPRLAKVPQIMYSKISTCKIMNRFLP